MIRQRNIAASVRDRLTARARGCQQDVQRVLMRYAIERFLYRLSRSDFRDRFVLKGAMLFGLWADAPHRATGDLDLLGFGESAAEGIADVVRRICRVKVDDDGVEFLVDTVRAEQAREEDEYQGVRVRLESRIAGARLPIQIDIGFGDVVTPGAQEIDYPTLLEFPAPRLRAYPPETVVAEKYQAMVKLGAFNSRMKDFYDLWAIAMVFRFEGPTLARAIKATFERRSTALPTRTPDALAPEFAADPTKQRQWRGFIEKGELSRAPDPFPTVQAKIGELITPPTEALVEGREFELIWTPGGPWSPNKSPSSESV